MDKDPFGTAPSTGILKALDVIGALDDLRPRLSQDFE